MVFVTKDQWSDYCVQNAYIIAFFDLLRWLVNFYKRGVVPAIVQLYTVQRSDRDSHTGCVVRIRHLGNMCGCDLYSDGFKTKNDSKENCYFQQVILIFCFRRVCVFVCVCLSVCLSVCSGYNFWTSWHINFILVWFYILTISRSSLSIKVIGSRSRSSHGKCQFCYLGISLTCPRSRS